MSGPTGQRERRATAAERTLVDAHADTELSPAASGESLPVSPALHSPLASTLSSPTLSSDIEDLPTIDPGRYEMLEEVGRGGLGRVLKAFDRRLKRVVAVKEMLYRDGSPSRFVREAVATAGLEHPGIISVHDAGRYPTGEPFYAMKFVSGRSLGDLIAERPTLAGRLALLPNVIAIADAMAYAHSKLLIHRDLKPANVLVGEFGETVIIDWGIAKRLHLSAPVDPPEASSAAEGEDVTRTGTVLGTPAYMAPEQAAGKDVDQRADVYSLGAILYQVLAGEPPHDAKSADVMLRILAGDPIPLEERQHGIAPDLLTIVTKAMARDPRRRYPTAKELADDLRRFETGQLVTSHQYSPWALLARWLRRYRIAVVLSATLLAALAVTGGVSIHRVVVARVVAETARRQAEAAERLAEAATSIATSRTNALLISQARALLEVDPTAALAVLETYPEGGNDWDGVGSLASDAWSLGVARHVFRGDREFLAAAFSPDGLWLAGAGADALVHVWDAETGAERRFAGQDGDAQLLVVSPDGRWIVSAGPLDRRIWVWDARSGEGRALIGHEDGMRWIGISATGVLASTSRDRTLRVWKLATGEGRILVRYRELRDCGRAAISPDGRSVAYGGVQRLHLLDADTGAENALPESEAGSGALAFSEDGRTLASGGMDGKVRVWDLPSRRVRVLRGHETWVSRLALSPDGRTLATVAGEGAAWLWNLGTGEGRMLPAPVGEVRVATFSPDGAYLAIGGDDRLIRLWEIPSRVLRVLRGHAGPISGLSFSRDGRRLASSSLDKTVRSWDLTAGGVRGLALPPGVTTSFLFSRDSELLALLRVNDPGAALLIGAVRTGQLRALGDPEPPAPPLAALGPDGKPLGDAEVALRLYVQDGGYCGAGGRVRDIHACAYSRDGRRVATAGNDKTVRIWEPGSTSAPEATRIVGRHEGAVYAVAFSPDGGTLASGGPDRTVRVWDVASGAERIFRGHEGTVEAVAFSADGARLGSVGIDGTLRVWDLSTGTARVFAGDQLAARSLTFAGDDAFVLVGERSGSVRMWDLATSRSRVVRRHGGFVGSIGVAPDGRTVISNGSDGSSWLWDLDAVPTFAQDPGALRRWMSAQTSAEIDEAGKVSTRAR